MYLVKMTFFSLCFGMQCAFVSTMASYMFVEKVYHAATSENYAKI